MLEFTKKELKFLKPEGIVMDYKGVMGLLLAVAIFWLPITYFRGVEKNDPILIFFPFVIATAIAAGQVGTARGIIKKLQKRIQELESKN